MNRAKALPLPNLSPPWFKSNPDLLGKLKITFFSWYVPLVSWEAPLTGIHYCILEYLSEQIGRWNPLGRFDEILDLLEALL